MFRLSDDVPNLPGNRVRRRRKEDWLGARGARHFRHCDAGRVEGLSVPAASVHVGLSESKYSN